MDRSRRQTDRAHKQKTQSGLIVRCVRNVNVFMLPCCSAKERSEKEKGSRDDGREKHVKKEEKRDDGDRDREREKRRERKDEKANVKEERHYRGVSVKIVILCFNSTVIQRLFKNLKNIVESIINTYD